MDINNNEELRQAVTEKETDEKCPSCGATLDYDPKTNGLFCEYCGYRNSIESMQKAQEIDFLSAEKTGNFNWGVKKKAVMCKSCGAENIYDELELASECPYCGSNQVVQVNSENILAPNGICPFRLTKEQAVSSYKHWLSKRWFCPSKAKKTSDPKLLHGVYIPYWTFDSLTTSDYVARYGRTRVVHTGKTTHTVTDWYTDKGRYREFINDQLVLASNRLNTEMLMKIEPFDTENSTVYNPQYLAGFSAERYSVGLKAGWEKAKKFMQNRLKKSVSDMVKKKKHADTMGTVTLQTAYANITYKYLLLPVWISSYMFKGKTYQFMVNGQTGKVAGRHPVSVLKILLTIGISLAILALILFFIYTYGGNFEYYKISR